MRRVLPLLLASLLVPTVLATPYAGTVTQGETRMHAFDNNPENDACIQLATTWVVTLAYSPPTDTLTLRVGDLVATGQSGLARVTFTAGVCTAFTMEVTGTSVALAAAYTLTPQSFAPAEPGGPVEWG